MKCKNDCGIELTGRQRSFCSDRCRKQSLRSATLRLKSDSNSDKTTNLSDLEVNSDKLGQTMTPEGLVDTDRLPVNYGQPDCECMHCQSARINNSKRTHNHGAYKRSFELVSNEGNRVSLPGDPDYAGIFSDRSYRPTGQGDTT